MHHIKLILSALLLLLNAAVHGQQLPTGPQVLTFHSSVDDTEQPYGLYLPPGYSGEKKYPLVIMLHGAGSNHRLALKRVFGKSNTAGENDVEASRYFPAWKDVNYIVASPYARGTMGYQGVAEKDVWDVLADVKKRFNVDEDRTYLTGLSMGGGGTLWIGLTRPDVWAALAPVCPAPPRETEQYLENGTNLPFHFYHGDADKAVPVTVSREWVKKLKATGTRVEYDEYPGVEHNSWENAYRDGAVFTWFSEFKREPFPARVKFASSQYKYNKAWWVRLDRLTPGTRASIDAAFTAANTLEVTTSALDAFTLKLKNHPRVEIGKPLLLTVNGRKIKTTATDSISFLLRDGKWIPGAYKASPNEKRPGAEGPLSEAFASRHIYVYGTAGNPSAQELRKRMETANLAANWSEYRNAFLGRIMVFPRVVADKDVRQSDIESADLILLGDRTTNLLIEKHASALPMELGANSGDLSLIYIFPLNGRYVVVNSGKPWWEGTAAQGNLPLLPHTLVPGQKDFVLFKGNPRTVVTEGNFDHSWQLPEEQKKILSSNGVSVKQVPGSH